MISSQKLGVMLLDWLGWGLNMIYCPLPEVKKTVPYLAQPCFSEVRKNLFQMGWIFIRINLLKILE